MKDLGGHARHEAPTAAAPLLRSDQRSAVRVLD
jgi:hypothetical protein